MDASEIEAAGLRHQIQAVAAEVAAMIRGLTDTGRVVPGSRWTVGEQAAHVALAQGLFAGFVSGAAEANPFADASDAEDFAAVNARLLGDHPERQALRLAGLIVENTEAFLDAVARRSPDFKAASPVATMDMDTYLSYSLCHTLMHGYSIARALGARSPLDAARVRLTVPFLKATMAAFVDERATRTMRARVQLRLRGGGPRWTLLFNQGTLTIEDTPLGAVDCYLSGTPIAFFLVGLGLKSQWGPIATLRLTAWGRRPWLAFRVKGLLPTP